MNFDTWKYFKISQLFTLKRGDINLSNTDEGTVPIVSSSRENNGIVGYGDVQPLYRNKLSIAINGNVGYTFYHQQPFNITGDCCVLIENFKMNKYVGLFLSTILTLMHKKYSYYRKLTNERLMNEKIMLPVTKENKPDFLFMENYIKQFEYNIKKQERKTIVLDIENWEYFNFCDLFDVVSITPIDLEQLHTNGKYPYITTSSLNNGVENNYSVYTEKGNVICIESACTGYPSYQSHNFSASEHIEKCIPKFSLNVYIAMFIITLLKKEQYKFSYGRKCSKNRIKEIRIKLPVTKENKPDFLFMENYIKNLKNHKF